MDQEELDRSLETLAGRKDAWAVLPVARKRELLREMSRRTGTVATDWVQAATTAKGTADQPNLAVEEWLGGPYKVLNMLNGLDRTLAAVEKGQTRLPRRVRTRAGGQVVADVFPLSAYDRILLAGVRGEVWMQPGVTVENLADHTATFYKQPAPKGKVALVLGAGNVASLAFNDTLQKLFTEGQVVMLKMNPVNAYLGVFYEQVLAPLSEAGYVRFAYGGPEVGAYLSDHKHVDELHLTGGARTHDAIVYGTGPEAAERKRKDAPVNTRRFTAELGCVTPTIVVQGAWSKAEVRYHAEHIVSQKFNNAGYNCLASQVLVLPAAWDQTPALLDAVRAVLRELPVRPAYYPGTEQRYRSILAAHPDAELLEPHDHESNGCLPRVIAGVDYTSSNDSFFTDECFCGVLAVTRIPGNTPAEFLSNAVRFANDTLNGTLSANLIVHPKTAKELGRALDEAIAELRYGMIGVNVWAAYGWLISSLTWGAFPGHTRNDIQSGSGVVHNTFMFEQAQKSVVKGPFVMRPKPVFVTHRNGYQLGQRFTNFEGSPGPSHLPGLIAAALKG